MTASAFPRPVVRGWCPSAHHPMEVADGWLVRARVGCRRIGAAAWQVLADLAAGEGNGLVEITMRGNVQVRGVAAEHTSRAAARLVECGLAAPTERADRRRTVVLDPLGERAPQTTAGLSCASIGGVVGGAEDIVEELGSTLPPKWWAVVDADALTGWPTPAGGCDVALRRYADSWQIAVAGREVAISTDPLPVLRLLAERCASEQCRGRELGVAGPPLGAEHRYQWWGLRQIADDWVAATSPPFGVATVAALEILAEAGATRSVALHPTPQRGVLMIGPQSAAGVIRDALGALAALGWVTSGDDRRRLVSACIGSRGCGASLVDTWHVAGELQPEVRTHVSGCEKRCGAPGGARHLVATATGLEEWPQ